MREFQTFFKKYTTSENCEHLTKELSRCYSFYFQTFLVGLHREDGFAAINNTNGSKLDRTGKRIIALLKVEGLSITIETNHIEKDFLNLTFNPATKKFFPKSKQCTTLH